MRRTTKLVLQMPSEIYHGVCTSQEVYNDHRIKILLSFRFHNFLTQIILKGIMSLQISLFNQNAKIVLFSAICTLGLIACSQQRQEESQTESFQSKATTSSEKQAITTTELPTETQREIEARFPTQPISKMINGVKMTAKVLPVTRGSMLFDSSVKQDAMVKGNVVVVTKDGAKLPASLSNLYKVEELTDGVYSLDVATSEDILKHYEKLKTNPALERVELGLFYGPEDGPETM